MPPETPVAAFVKRNKDLMYWGAILYLFGINQTQKAEIKKSDESATHWQNKHINHLEAERDAATRIAFRAILRSDTTYIFSLDSLAWLPLPSFRTDTTKKPPLK